VEELYSKTLSLKWALDKSTKNHLASQWFDQKPRNQDFAWRDLREQHHRKKGFNNNSEYRTPRTLTSIDNPPFLSQQILDLAGDQECSLTWLLLLLAPTAALRNLLKDSPIQYTTPTFLALTEATSENTLHQLTLEYFLTQAIYHAHIEPSINAIECFTPYMLNNRPINLPTTRLYAYFNNPQLDPRGRLFKINIKEQSLYVEIINESVTIYGVREKPLLMSYQHFLDQLHSSLCCGIPTKDARSLDITLQIYTKPKNFETRLKNTIRRASLRWKKQGGIRLTEYINMNI